MVVQPEGLRHLRHHRVGRHRLEIRRPPGTAYVGYYNQAINKDAPHPAAARLWEEYLYSDAAQNAWLTGGAYPARVDAMEKVGTLDTKEFPGKLDEVAVMTDKQATDAGTLLHAKWANAVS